MTSARLTLRLAPGRGWNWAALSGAIALAVIAVALLPAPPLLSTLLRWLPHLAQGFAMNVLISVLAVGLGTLGGIVLGGLELSPFAAIRRPTHWFVQTFRNAPLLVMVYFSSYIFPFEISIQHHYVAFPDWLKATLGLALPASAYVAEIVRGAVRSISTAQWQSAKALGFRRIQTLRWVILPQCVKRALPPWMNLYATITMGTTLASLVGVADLLNAANNASAAVHSTNFTIVVYLSILVWFFLYCYAISAVTKALERKYAFH
ncbi:amino acid ABC transporter permease [Telmatospirillum siberiense]|uniref:Amino acid ABC transporter n=1 Tax=Telmatospirillum siberiense TaxID=382514 RepID=A0A2N3Q1K2_9PROT|nr:amino acid ABC transporter permease [Telmatospirillum siberiense]PKU26537.1 amino acid ABC transporter [Telmatospirillum siberiense]